MFRNIIILLLSMLVSASAYSTGNNSGDYYESPLTPTRFVSYQGINIAVYESSGTGGPGILMVHGNTSSANSYFRIFNSQFAQQNKVVLLDLPGHGRSDNAQPAQYNIALNTGVIAAVAAATGTDKGVLVGWSLGAFYAIQATQSLPNLKGLFVFGDAVTNLDPNLPPPFLTPQQSYAGDAVTYGTIAALTPIQVVDYVNAFFRPNFGRVPGHMLADGLSTDPNTRQAVLNIVLGQDPFVDPVTILANIQIPIALVNGKDDAFVNNARFAAIEGMFPTLYTGKAILLNNTGHVIQYERPQLFNFILGSFVNSL